MKTKFTLLVLLSLEASLLTGCVGVLPVPQFSAVGLEGRKIERGDVKFIVTGVTTRREVERRLGPSTRHCDRPPACAYSWETPGWKVYWWLAGPGGAAGDDFPVGGWHAFFVVFNDKGIVLQTKFASLGQRMSLDDELENWAKRVRASLTSGKP